jgi:hypothetical protein
LNFDVQTELPQELLDARAKVMVPARVAQAKKPLTNTSVPVETVPVLNAPVLNAPVNPVPVKPVPVKPVPVKTEPVKLANVKTEPVKPDPIKTKPVKTEPVKTEPVKTEPLKPAPFEPTSPVLADAPAYGNLKNGSKPTFKQLSQKNKQTTPEELPAVKKVSGKSAKRRITKTLKYNLGKQKNGKHISVYIKNEATRNLINAERKTLKNTSFQDIKTYLRQKNLLKIGSEITPDLAHHLYENAILAGDVTNQSNEHLRHNFFSKDME